MSYKTVKNQQFNYFIILQSMKGRKECPGQEYVNLYIHSPIRLHSVLLN
jgi:hypothetical protein